MAARNSSDLASCRRATSKARRNAVSTSVSDVPGRRRSKLPPEAIQLRLSQALSRGLRGRQCLVQGGKPRLDLPVFRVSVGQQPQEIRLPDRAPRLALGRQILTDLADLLPPLAGHSQRRCTKDPADCQKELEPLLRRQRDERLGLLVRGVGFWAQLVGNGRQHPREGVTRGMRQLLGQGVCSPQLPQGLVGIAQQPEHDGRPAPAAHARVVPIENGQCAVLLEVVEATAS